MSLGLDTKKFGLSSRWADPHLESPPSNPWALPFIQTSELFEHTMTRESDKEALSLLGECVNDSVNLERTDCNEETLFPLENLLVERYNGEFAGCAERLNDHTKLEPAFQLLRFSVYLSSNNLLSGLKTDKLVNWICKSKSQRILYRLLDLKTSTTEIFGSNVLVSAARLGLVDVIHNLILKGVEINALVGDSHPRTALQEAVSNNRFRVVEALLNAGADLRLQMGPTYSILHEALKRPHSYDIVQMLIKYGADVNAPFDEESYEGYILTCAAHNCDCAMVQILLAAGALINRMCKYSTTALQASVEQDDLETVQALIDGGADIDAPAGESYIDVREAIATDHLFGLLTTPIQLASEVNNTELAQILVYEGADVNACPWENYINEICLLSVEVDFDPVRTALQAAVAHNNVILVRLLLKAGADVNMRGCPFTALQIAATNANIQIARILLNHGANVNAPASTSCGSTALQAASSTDNPELVQLLLDAGADVNGAASPREGRTALQEATKCGNIDIAKTLIEAGANVNASASPVNGRTCLQAAAEYGHVELVRLLLDKGADVNSPAAIESGGLTALQAALLISSERCHPEVRTSHEKASTTIVQALLDAGADVNAPPSPRESLSTLEAAIKTGRPELVQSLFIRGLNPNCHVKSDPAIIQAVLQESFDLLLLLIEAGADINVRCTKYDLDEITEQELTALEAVASIGSIPIAEILLDAGAILDDDTQGLSFHRPLHWAVSSNSTKLVQLLLDKGANPNAQAKIDRRPSTVLEEALSGWPINIDIVSTLLEAGADANKIAHPRCNPLRQAATQGSVEAVQLLLKAGARPDLILEDQETALQAAVKSRNIDLVEILIAAGADINAPAGPILGRTALQEATEMGDITMVKCFLSHDADVNAPAAKSHGITALQGAVISGHLKITLMLLQAGAKINAPAANFHGRTALEAAAEHGRLDIMLLLLKNDHDDDNAEAVSLRCKRAAKLAATNGHQVIARILNEHAGRRGSGS